MYYQTKTGTPCAYITKDKKRLKQVGQNVYLKNGDEFELELFNPSSDTVLSKIKLDGKYISGGGIVLKPGQRIFLERYLDDPRKFKFETYEVDGTSNEVLDAISGNGDVVIEFFGEFEHRIWNQPINHTGYGNLVGSSLTTNTNNLSSYNSTTLGGNFNDTVNSCSYNSTTLGGNFNNVASFTTLKLNNQQVSLTGPNIKNKKSKGKLFGGEVTINEYSSKNKSIETGRVEKGSNSDQSFQSVNKIFNLHTCSISIWKILPESQKIYDNKDLKVYCTNCGKKRKKDSDKFCSSCGNKF